ncbi:MAG: T9SS type A sorting domain-containing protein [Ignavibacteria bacterium]|nr:T9SS type A sorting domain-containing protein [Ignavibacteria bacterium]
MIKKLLIGNLLLFLFLFGTGYTQNWDDPNFDRIPLELLRQSQILHSSKEIQIVTSPEGYDNIFLGVDFAEPHMSMNPLNILQHFTAFNINATHYTMNGLDWFSNNPNLPSPAGDPVTAYDSIGNLYYMNMTGSTIIGCYVVKSTDNGQSWFPPVFAISGNDKNWIACDQTGGPYANYVYCTMTAGSGYGSFSRSTNFGTTFQATFSPNTQNLPGMMVCVGPRVGPGTDIPGGVVYVVTNYGSTFTPYYYFYKSTDGGLTFNLSSNQQFAGYVGTAVNNRHSVENMRTRPYPFIAADNSYGPYRGRLYLIYADNDPPGNGNKPDVFCRYSTDQGVTWSTRVRINDDANPQANHQWFPAIWCDKETGRLYVKWLDTRNCPTSDSCDVYASYSDNGGVSFVANQRITTRHFKIDCSTCGGGGTPRYLGDYDAITSNSKTSLMVWTDYRAGNFGSYVAWFPDFAMTTRTIDSIMLNNDSAFAVIKVPGSKLYNDIVRFTAAVDTAPATGSISLSFVNGKDSITTIPDSVTLRIKTTGTVTPGQHTIYVDATGSNGTPVHRRNIDVYINASPVSIGTNREGFCYYEVNGIQHNTRKTFIFNNGSSVNIKAISPRVLGGTQYVYTNWSNNGDTAQTITITEPLILTAFYKTQFKLTIVSSIGNTFGGGIFYDSAVAFTFGVNSRIYSTGGQTYQFRGWTGAGTGAYTSPDSSGTDSVITHIMHNAIVETARWQNITGITNISTEIPKEYKLSQNYPNPFNPVTRIRFDLPFKKLVKINVYDITGKEVTCLVNNFLEPGTYEVMLNAAGLPSGVYFYKMSTDNYTSIKKLILIK